MLKITSLVANVAPLIGEISVSDVIHVSLLR